MLKDETTVRDVCMAGILGDGLFKQRGTLEARCSPGGGKSGKEQLLEGGQLKTRQAPAECHARESNQIRCLVCACHPS